MKRAPRTAHLQLAPARAPTPSSDEPVVYPSLTRADVARRYPKNDPAEVASVQDTEVARVHGICAAWSENGRFCFVPGRLVG